MLDHHFPRKVAIVLHSVAKFPHFLHEICEFSRHFSGLVDVKGRALQTPGGIGEKLWGIICQATPKNKEKSQIPMFEIVVKDGSIFVGRLLYLPLDL